MGKKLTWKAKEKRPNLMGDDHSSSSSNDKDEEDSGDEESLEDEVGTDVGSLTKGKESQLMQKNNMGGQHMGDPDKDQGSQGIDADPVDLAEFS